MLVKEEKKRIILGDGHMEYGSVYRGILELMGRFGYVSMDEVVYGYELSEQEARDRLKYLVRQGLIEPFSSLASPQYFYCLTNEGMFALRSYGISDEIHGFNPDSYRPYHFEKGAWFRLSRVAQRKKHPKGGKPETDFGGVPGKTSFGRPFSNESAQKEVHAGFPG